MLWPKFDLILHIVFLSLFSDNRSVCCFTAKIRV